MKKVIVKKFNQEVKTQVNSQNDIKKDYEKGIKFKKDFKNVLSTEETDKLLADIKKRERDKQIAKKFEQV